MENGGEISAGTEPKDNFNGHGVIEKNQLYSEAINDGVIGLDALNKKKKKKKKKIMNDEEKVFGLCHESPGGSHGRFLLLSQFGLRLPPAFITFAFWLPFYRPFHLCTGLRRSSSGNSRKSRAAGGLRGRKGEEGGGGNGGHFPAISLAPHWHALTFG